MAITDCISFDTFNLHPYAFDHFDKSQLSPGSALHCFGAAKDFKGEEFKPFHVQGMMGVSLEHLCLIMGLDFPNHIKIDVDGIEQKVVTGASKILQDERLKSVLIEISSKNKTENPVYEQFMKAGFIEDNDYNEHSSKQLKGSPWEECHNIKKHGKSLLGSLLGMLFQ